MRFKKFFWGVFFILAAIFIVVSQVYPNSLFEQIGFWSIAVTVFLAAILLESIAELHYFGIFVPLAILYSIYQTPLSLPYISFWKLIFAAVLISIGLHMLIRKGKLGFCFGNEEDGFFGRSSSSGRDETLTGNRLYAQASFCDSSKYLHSDCLEKGEFSVSFGRMNVYFDQVQLSPSGVTVHLGCSFGELNVYLPKHWQVKDKLHATLGSIENTASRFAEASGPLITLKGGASFGTIRIHYVS